MAIIAIPVPIVPQNIYMLKHMYDMKFVLNLGSKTNDRENFEKATPTSFWTEIKQETLNVFHLIMSENQMESNKNLESVNHFKVKVFIENISQILCQLS